MPFDAPSDPAPDPRRRSRPRLLTGLRRGLQRRCPACGQGSLFCGYLRVLPTCRICGNDNERYPSDDFAPYVTIFVVLHLMVPPLLFADHAWNPAVWVEAAWAIPVFAMATLALLPFIKGGVIGFAWALGVSRQQNAEAP